MSGGISQLVAIGAQDAYLTGSPQVSFFRAIYKRHTNFAMTRENQVIQGTQGAGNMSTIRFERKGDLLSYIYFYKKMTDGYHVVDLTASGDQIKKTELYIGGQLIDSEERTGVNARGRVGSPNSASANAGEWGSPSYTFCKYFAAVLPLVALQYHDVEMRIYWNDIPGYDTDEPVTCVANYIYLDTDEREFFANNAHNILIEQIQRNTFPPSQTMLDLSFSHPVKYITAVNTSDGDAHAVTYKMQINGVDVGDEQPVVTSALAMSSRHCSNELATTVNLFIPFALQCGSYQPSGTLNFSRLDSARIILDRHAATANAKDIIVTAVNYNMLRIENGMGGLEYAN